MSETDSRFSPGETTNMTISVRIPSLVASFYLSRLNGLAITPSSTFLHYWSRRTSSSSSTCLIHSLKSRGVIKEVIPETEENLKFLRDPQTFYAGFDPTSDSLHFGNLLVLVTLLHFTRAGHQPICVVGDATAAIGDPSGRLYERPGLEESDIDINSEGISSDISKIFSNHLKYFWKPKSQVKLREPIILRNKSWYQKMNVIDFVSGVGRKIRLTDMLAKSSVEERLKTDGAGLSLAEFSYQAFQAYDWLVLRDRYNCSVQVGGSDQRGNITTGLDLIRKSLNDRKAIGMTIPLLTDELGSKYGKSTGSRVWLSEKKMTPFDFYQYFVRVHDSEVGKFLKLFTFIPDDEIERIMTKFLKKTDSRYAQERLAEAATLLVHGPDGLSAAKRTTSALFDNDINALSEMTAEEMKRTFGESAHYFEFYFDPEKEMTTLDLVMKIKGFTNMKEAGNAIRNGGLFINSKREKDPQRIVSENDDILPNDTTLLRIGKIRYYIIKWR